MVDLLKDRVQVVRLPNRASAQNSAPFLIHKSYIMPILNSRNT